MQPLYAGIVINKKIEATDRVFTYIVPENMQQQIKLGMAVKVPFAHSVQEGVVVELTDATEVSGLKEIRAIISPEPLFDAKMLELSAFMSEYYMCTRAAAIGAMLPAGLALTGKLPQSKTMICYYPAEKSAEFNSREKKQQRAFEYIMNKPGCSLAELQKADVTSAVLKKLQEKELIFSRRERKYSETVSKEIKEIVLSPEQQQVFEGLSSLLGDDAHTALLHGVTGSGKTEIYLRLAEKVIKMGKQVLILVPEIALTPQMVDFVSRRLSVDVAVMHSAMTNVERRSTWQEIAEGKYPVVLGARSAVFAPLHDPGLIIIDEEQEGSYKQDNVPRFHAREIAAKRAELSNALLLLGSATPSLESYYKAQKGEYHFFALTQRFHQPLLPKVHIVDMRAELEAGNRSMFSALLYEKISQRLQNNEQVLLLLNRRGYYTFYSCRSCGGVIKCPHCEVPLAFHEREGMLKCHYCGHIEKPVSICPHCGSTAIRHFGTGTQRVAAEVQRLFPEAKVLRMDSDITSQRGAHEMIYNKMRDHEADILVGTQMIAKGLDFPDVTLSAVLAADSMLNMPDWRAGERSFQLLTQLIGRAGRRDKQGEAVIQTYMPSSYIVEAASRQDYESFYGKEIMIRELAYNPPFCHMINLLFTDENLQEAEYITKLAAGYLREFLGENGYISGPAPDPLEKIKNRWRIRILLKGEDMAKLREAVNEMLFALHRNKQKPASILIHIDADPMD